jgi:hypothetical protein
MKKYMIEREIPKIGTLELEQVRKAAAKSNQVLHQLGPDIQWLESCIAGIECSASTSPRTLLLSTGTLNSAAFQRRR